MKKSKRGKDGKGWLKNADLTVCMAEVTGAMKAVEPLTGMELRAEVEVSLSVTADEATKALETAYASKAWDSLRAGPTDLAFEADMATKLRVDSKGNKLALTADDCKGRSMDLQVILGTQEAPVVRKLGGALYHNKLVALSRKAERIISDSRCNTQSVRQQAEYLRIQLKDKDKAVQKAVLADFYSAYRVQLPKDSAKEFLKLKEPRFNRIDAVKAAVGATKLSSLDELIARKEAAFKASQASKA